MLNATVRANARALPEFSLDADHERLIREHLTLETPIAELEYILRAAERCFDYTNEGDDLSISGIFLVNKALGMATDLVKQYGAIAVETRAQEADTTSAETI